MSQPADQSLVERIRAGDGDAWSDLIGRYDSRLLAYVSCRLQNRSLAEDVVQETFIGLLNSLPNYDGRRPLENYLFSICSHKLTDALRREGRRPTVSISPANSAYSHWQLPANSERASSIARSDERRSIEEQSLRDALVEQLQHWRQRGDWKKIQCLELIIVRGWANKRAAEFLQLSQQQVATYKHEFVGRLCKSVRSQGLPEEVFPEMYLDDDPAEGVELSDG